MKTEHDLLTIGITGGIGSGKSAVADLFIRHGAALVDTDAIAHALTAPGGGAIGAIRQAFGDGMIAPDGRMDRAAMRHGCLPIRPNANGWKAFCIR